MDVEETFLFLSNRRDRQPNSSVKGSGANHHPRAPAQDHVDHALPGHSTKIMLRSFEAVADPGGGGGVCGAVIYYKGLVLLTHYW